MSHQVPQCVKRLFKIEKVKINMKMAQNHTIIPLKVLSSHHVPELIKKLTET